MEKRAASAEGLADCPRWTQARCRLWHGGGDRHRSWEGRAERRRPGCRAGSRAPRTIDHRRLARRQPPGRLAHNAWEGADARV